MSLFDEREKAFENKFVHDEELLFRFYARRNKLLGRWAADLLGKSGDERDAYAREVVLADLAEVDHDSDVYKMISADLSNVADEATIRVKMAEFLEAAKEEVMREEP
ncbi:MAG: DUF1476 domain-containing protein [Pseudomonadota bacterium]